MKSVLVLGSTYVDLDRFKVENNLYSKTEYYKREGVGEYHFLSTNDPKFLTKIKGKVYNDLVLVGNPYLDYQMKGEVYNRIQVE